MNVDYTNAVLSGLTINNLAYLFIALACLFVLDRVVRGLSDAMMKKFPHERMAILQISTVAHFIVYFVGGCTVLYIVFRPTKEVCLWFLTSGLLTIGFAVKDLFASVIASLMLFIDKPFQVGDRIIFKNVQGEVIEIGFRSVKLRATDKGVITIPNQCFLSDMVSSRSAGELGMFAAVNTHVNTTNISLARAKELLEQVARKNQYVNSQQKITVAAREVLGGSGFPVTVLTTKCKLIDARTEEAFQTQFLADAYHVLQVEQSRICVERIQP